MMASPHTTPLRRGVATIADLYARSIVDAASGCWIWQGARTHGSARIWTLNLDDLEKMVLSGPRAVWYITHGTALGERVAYMSCWHKGCVCPAHVRSAPSRGQANSEAARAGVYRRSPAARQANAVNARKARQARGVVDTPPEVVLAVRAAAGTGTQEQIGRRLGLTKTVASRILRGETFRHLLPTMTQAQSMEQRG